MGVAQSVKDGKLPYQPEGVVEPITKTVTFKVKYFCCQYGGKYWMFTGLWALAGKFVKVSSPDIVLGRVKIIIGARVEKCCKIRYFVPV